jgi:eukaryotic-like serine/threonine-protein kinase
MPLAPLSVGTVLNDTYELIGLLGSGGMGTVWRAHHQRLPKDVAVKLLRFEVGLDAELVARFRQEAAIVAKLVHPHIVEVLDYNVLPDGQPYLVFELLEGESLRERLKRGQVLLREALGIVDQVAAGLQAAHLRGIVHRDLKPENIFLCALDDGSAHAKILDFGLSKMLSSQVTLTHSGSLFGTPLYMSPEQAAAKPVDARGDQYSLACVTFELLAGRPPFIAEQPLQVLYLVVNEPAPSLTALAPRLPAAVGAVVSRGLSKRPEDRFPDVRGFVAALHAAAGEAQPSARVVAARSSGSSVNEAFDATLAPGSSAIPTPATPAVLADSATLPASSGALGTGPPGVARRRRWPELLAALAFLALLAGGVGLLVSSRHGRAPSSSAHPDSRAADAQRPAPARDASVVAQVKADRAAPASTVSTPRPKTRPRPEKVALSPGDRERLAEAHRQLQAGLWSQARLLGERLERDLRESEKWRARSIRARALCGQADYAAVDTCSSLPPAERARVLAFCRRYISTMTCPGR